MKSFKVFKKTAIPIVLIILTSCDPALNLIMNANDSRFGRVYEQGREILKFNNDMIAIDMFTKLNTNWGDYRQNKKIGKVLGVELHISCTEDFKFFVNQCYLTDNTGDRLNPSHASVFHKDNYYEKGKTHEIGIVFNTPLESEEHIDLPANLSLPPIIYVSKKDTLRFPKITIE